jgi:hypothetical protein
MFTFSVYFLNEESQMSQPPGEWMIALIIFSNGKQLLNQHDVYSMLALALPKPD